MDSKATTFDANSIVNTHPTANGFASVACSGVPGSCNPVQVEIATATAAVSSYTFVFTDLITPNSVGLNFSLEDLLVGSQLSLTLELVKHRFVAMAKSGAKEVYPMEVDVASSD